MPLDNITELKRRVPGGKYALTRALAERARQLQNGAVPLTEVKAPNPLSVAIDEIVQGKITFLVDDSDDSNAAETKKTERVVMDNQGQIAAPSTQAEGTIPTGANAAKAAVEDSAGGQRAQTSGAEDAVSAFGPTGETPTQADTKTDIG
jgi:DNA-directed RNA polymerase subunit K/omega